MSIEQAMLKQAEAAEKLADAMNRYADVVEKYGLKLETENKGKATVADQEKAGAKATGSKATGAKATGSKAKSDDDGFGDDKPTKPKPKKTVSVDDAKALLLKVKNVAGDKQPALDIIAEFGYSKLPEVQEKDAAAIAEKAQEWLDENGGEQEDDDE